MATITVANLEQNGNLSIYGQCFSPSYTGPDGSGPAAVSSLLLVSVAVGCGTYAPACANFLCYVYSAPLTHPTQIGQQANLVGQSSGCSPGAPFPDGSASVQFGFDATFVDSTGAYYLYCDPPLSANVIRPADGGDVISYSFADDPEHTAQFIITMDDGLP